VVGLGTALSAWGVAVGVEGASLSGRGCVRQDKTNTAGDRANNQNAARTIGARIDRLCELIAKSRLVPRRCVLVGTLTEERSL